MNKKFWERDKKFEENNKRWRVIKWFGRNTTMHKAVTIVIAIVLSLLAVLAGFYFIGRIIVGPEEGPVTPVQVEVISDKVTYEPGENVSITALVKNNGNKTLEKMTVNFTIKDALGTLIYNASKVIDKIEIESEESASLTWKAGESMPRGYAADVHVESNGELLGQGRVIFDVTNWTQVPRYGFFAIYGYEGTTLSPKEEYIDKKVADMAKFHINSIQFYDWFEHHGNYTPPKEGVYNIKGLNKYIKAEKVLEKISRAHQHGMKCMAYVVVYAVADVIYNQHPDWALTNKEGVPQTFGSGEFVLYYVCPSRDCGWHDYAIDQFVKSMQIFDWDGMHIDQYDSMYSAYWNGKEVDLVTPFVNFVDDTREAIRQVKAEAAVTFNTISKKPPEVIKDSKEDFVYVETWISHSYGDIADLIRSCRTLSNGKPVVLAAYTPKGSSKPTILLLDAVIFANQGFHIELGEGNSILTDPYFPRYEELPKDTVEALRNYYGHITRYEEYMYGSDVERSEAVATIINHPYSIVPQAGKIYVIDYRRVRDGEPTELISHFINFKGVNNMAWNTRWQLVPTELKDVEVKVPLPERKMVTAVYLASPDDGDGDPIKLSYNVENGYVQFVVPSLRYWSTAIVKLGGEASTSHEFGIGMDQIESFHMNKVYVALKEKDDKWLPTA